MKFTHLHVHSHYSLLDGLAKIDDLVKRAAELEMDSIALTDHGNLYGAIEFYQKANKAGIKPILGAELYIAYESRNQKRAGIDDQRYHLTVLAENEKGYKNLIQLVSKAHLEGFYYKPRADKELLARHHEGLIALSGCASSEISRALATKNLEKAEKLALEYQNIFGKNNFYLEIQDFPNFPENKLIREGLIKLSGKLKIPLVATADVHYLKPEDAEAQDILVAVQTASKVDDKDRLTMKRDDFSLKSKEKMAELFKEMPEALAETQNIAERCNLSLKFGETQLPHFSVPENYDSDTYLKKLCFENISKRYGENEKNVSQRLDYELGVIQKMGFASYFLIIHDLVSWAKAQKIAVGPGRGSAAGSLVSYLLGITNIDPLKYNLLFERFLNPDRIAPPDIDLDFDDLRRDEVIQYAASKYGKDHVAQIITFGTMAARAAIRDSGRSMGYPYSFCDKIAKLIPMHMSLKESVERVPEMKQIFDVDPEAKRLILAAQKLEGNVRHASTHACGVVITKKPLMEYTPLQKATKGNNESAVVTQYEMHACEDLGLLKMDFLGLKNLTVIEQALNLIKTNKGQTIDINAIPVDDKKTFKLLAEARTIGIFQLESSGMRRYLKELKPTEFEDIIAMVSLYRPGPMELIPEYIARKHGKKRVEYLHSNLEPVLKNTYGIMIYQEQLMQMVQAIAGFTLAEADILRKAVGKKIRKLLQEQKDKFFQGTLKNKISEEIAEKLWKLIEPFDRYGFNRSHGAAYALIAYQTAYLKAYYPQEFMAALMTSDSNDLEKIAVFIEEAKKIKIKVLPPDINESFENFTPVNQNEIRFGLVSIKNVGDNIVASIIKERQNGKFKNIFDFAGRISSKDLNKKSLESLIKSGALDNLGERNQLLQNLENILEFSRSKEKTRQRNQTSLFDLSNEDYAQNIKLTQAESAKKNDILNWEKEFLGLYLTSHPLEDYKPTLEKIALPIFEAINIIGKPIKIGGIISSAKKIFTKSGKEMMFLKLEDFSDSVEAILFSDMIERNKGLALEGKKVIASGKMSNRDGETKLILEELKELSI